MPNLPPGQSEIKLIGSEEETVCIASSIERIL